jgi:hypothetical protein
MQIFKITETEYYTEKQIEAKKSDFHTFGNLDSSSIKDIILMGFIPMRSKIS